MVERDTLTACQSFVIASQTVREYRVRSIRTSLVRQSASALRVKKIKMDRFEKYNVWRREVARKCIDVNTAVVRQQVDVLNVLLRPEICRYVAAFLDD